MTLFSFSLIYSRFNSFQLSYHRGTEDSEMIVIYRSHSSLSQINVTDLDSGKYYHFRVQARSGAGYGPSVNQSSFTLPARPAKPTVPNIISYTCSNQRLTLKLFPNIVDEKHFYMARVYADDVSLPKAKIQEEKTSQLELLFLLWIKLTSYKMSFLFWEIIPSSLAFTIQSFITIILTSSIWKLSLNLKILSDSVLSSTRNVLP